MAKTQKQEISLSLDSLEAIAKELTEIDTRIAAATGSDAAIRKSIAEKLATDNAETVDKVVGQITAGLESMSLEVVIGLRSKLDDVLSEKFDSAIKDFLDTAVEEATKDSKEDVTKLREDRKAKLDDFRSMKTVLETFKIDTSSVPEPKRARQSNGSSGGSKSGKNKEGYQFTMDGKDRPASQNSFSSLAYYSTMNCAGEGNRWGVAQLKDFLAEQGVKYGEQDTWEVELPNKTKIGARRFTAEEIAAFEAADAEDNSADEATTDEAPATAEEVPAV